MLCVCLIPSTFAQMSFSHSCLQYNKNFFYRYFSGWSQPTEINNFFQCVDNSIQFFLNHTTTSHGHYYNQREIKHFMQYMGFRLNRADQISRSFFVIKKGFIGGQYDQITLREIQIVRMLLVTIRNRLYDLRPYLPTLLSFLNKKPVSDQYLFQSINKLKSNISLLGQELSRMPFSAHIPSLEKVPQHLQILGFQSNRLKYWSSAFLLIKQWKKTFSYGPNDIIQPQQWSALLDPFSKMAELWFYYKKFLENKSFLSVDTVPHTQHFVSSILGIIESYYPLNKTISWMEIDALARKIWFLPVLSSPKFQLGFRSMFCFVLDRLVAGKHCRSNMVFRKNMGWSVHFGDLAFSSDTEHRLKVSHIGEKGGSFTRKHIQIMQKYLNSWIRSEQILKTTGHLPEDIFGTPNQWLKRPIHLTPDRQLLFNHTVKVDRTALLSHLNWQSHFMQMIVSAYADKTKPHQLSKQNWKQITREWTAMVLGADPDIEWESFQEQAFTFFSQGDILTSYSNGDGFLQESEVLELFSLSFSAWQSFLSSRKFLQTCTVQKEEQKRKQCVWHLLKKNFKYLFPGFPSMSRALLNGQWSRYVSALNQFQKPLDNLFTLYMIIYHQENMLAYRDTDHSGDINLQELSPLINVFYNVLDGFPFIYNHRDVLALTTYLFHHGEMPIIKGGNVSSPVRFAEWLIRPEKWQNKKIGRSNLLKALIYLNQSFP